MKRLDMDKNNEKQADENRRNFLQVPVMTKPIPLPKDKGVKAVQAEEIKKDC
jgi:hypothetical protein